MRIPVNSCEGCNKEFPVLPSGHHCMGNGLYQKCAFVDAEMQSLPNCKLLAVYPTRKQAIRKATKQNASIQWAGQAPTHMYLVVAEHEVSQ